VYIPSHTLLPLAIISKRIKPSVKVVVHLHNYQPLTYTSVLLAGRRPNMATDLMVERREHDSLLRAVFAGLGHYINLVSRLALHYADKVICVSRRQHEILIKNMPMLKGKTIMVYNPLPQLPNVEKGLDPKPIILYAGGDSYVKGFHTFLRASQKVLEQGYDVKFLLAGGFKNVNRLIIEKLNERFKGAYNLLGYLRHEKFLKLHTITHALLFPSICEEPFPYVVLEAMLMGTLPVASKVGGIPEIVKGTYAEKMLFEAGNVEEFVDRMESILAMSKEQIKDVGFSLREATLKRFNSEITKRNLVKIFS
jgi:glycosyltransferase involved in cell wall biosynthesis